MTLYQGHTYEHKITSEEALHKLGAELRAMMGYDEAVYFVMGCGDGLHNVVRKIEDKIAEMKVCDHIWITPVTGGVSFTGGEVDDNIEVGRDYCPMCGMLKPEQPAELSGEELPI